MARTTLCELRQISSQGTSICTSNFDLKIFCLFNKLHINHHSDLVIVLYQEKLWIYLIKIWWFFFKKKKKPKNYCLLAGISRHPECMHSLQDWWCSWILTSAPLAFTRERPFSSSTLCPHSVSTEKSCLDVALT